MMIYSSQNGFILCWFDLHLWSQFQSSRDGSGYWSILVNLSLQLVMVRQGLSVVGLKLVLVVPHLVERSTSTTSQVGVLLQTSQDARCPLSEKWIFILDSLLL